jgi:hypothetical protein
MERKTLINGNRRICIDINSINSKKMVNFGTKVKEYVHKEGKHRYYPVYF